MSEVNESKILGCLNRLGSIYRNTVPVKKCAETTNWKSDDWHRLLVCHIAWRAQRAMQCGTTKAVYQYMAPLFRIGEQKRWLL